MSIAYFYCSYTFIAQYMYGQQPGYGMQQPGYGMQPGYGQPPPPMYGGGPQVVVIQQNEATISNMTQMGKISTCALCQKETDNVMRHKVGGVTFAWCCCLLVTTGFLFWVPFCCDGCKDTEVVCQGCQLVKTTVPANCC